MSVKVMIAESMTCVKRVAGCTIILPPVDGPRLKSHLLAQSLQRGKDEKAEPRYDAVTKINFHRLTFDGFDR